MNFAHCMKTIETIRLRRDKEHSIRRRHQWIFSGALYPDKIKSQDGDIVYVENEFGERLAFGHYHKASISVRILNFGIEDYNDSIWEELLQAAWNYRSKLGLINNDGTNCFRWVHGEGDNLSGLIIDVYNEIAVIQCHTIGMHKFLELIKKAIIKIASPKITSIVLKSKESLSRNYASNITDQIIYGESSYTTVMENGIPFFIDILEGQKTGFFLDQRVNRKILGDYSNEKNILNTFCYTGGFSMYALQNSAKSVTSIDISKKAIDLVDKNESLISFNGSHEKICADVIDYLKNIEANKYNIIVLDPPAFAKSMDKRHQAIQAYKRINILAMQKIIDGGFLFTFSCSQVVDEETFFKTVVAAGIESRKKIRVVQKLQQSPDHPVSLFHPEGAYLKGLIVEVS